MVPPKSEARLERNIGKAVIDGTRALFTEPKTWAAIVMGLGLALGVSHSGLLDRTDKVDGASDLKMLTQSINKLRGDVIEVKVTTRALVDSLPERQRNATKALIDDRMAVLRMASAPRQNPD